MNLKSCKHLAEVFLLVKVTFFNDESQMFLIFQPIFNTFTTPAGVPDKTVEGNLEGYHMKKLCLLLKQIRVFLQKVQGIIYSIKTAKQEAA